MPWVRIDDDWYQHPKVIAAGLKGRAMWFTAACWSSANDTGGHIPQEALRLLAAAADIGSPAATVRRLVEVDLWHPAGDQCDDPTCPASAAPVPPGQWLFHGWWLYQLSDEERIARSERARANAISGWQKRTRRHADRNATRMQPACDDLCENDALPPAPAPEVRTSRSTAAAAAAAASPKDPAAAAGGVLLAQAERTARASGHPPNSPTRWRQTVAARIEAEHGDQLRHLAAANPGLEPYEIAAMATGQSKYDLRKLAQPEGGYL